MTPDRWQQISQIYHAALAKDPNERGRFLAQTCEGDVVALQREVESLLASEGTAEGFLAAPALKMAAKVMVENSGGSLTGRQIDTYQIQSALGAKLVEGRYYTGSAGTGGSPGRTYDVSLDGRRFLMIKEAVSTNTTSPPPELIVVQPWFEELKRLVPTK